MEFVVTQGRCQVAPIPPADPEAPEGSVAGYILNFTDGPTGIILRLSMEFDNAAQLGQALVEHTSKAQAWRLPPQVETFAEVPHHLRPVDGGGQGATPA